MLHMALWLTNDGDTEITEDWKSPERDAFCPLARTWSKDDPLLAAIGQCKRETDDGHRWRANGLLPVRKESIDRSNSELAVVYKRPGSPPSMVISYAPTGMSTYGNSLSGHSG